jgi:hypothetical protein
MTSSSLNQSSPSSLNQVPKHDDWSHLNSAIKLLSESFKISLITTITTIIIANFVDSTNYY